jgi:hypothetical protein
VRACVACVGAELCTCTTLLRLQVSGGGLSIAAGDLAPPHASPTGGVLLVRPLSTTDLWAALQLLSITGEGRRAAWRADMAETARRRVGGWEPLVDAMLSGIRRAAL